MLRSLMTAVTGLRNHQTKMDVIGNNIANVNTVGFKASQARFEDLYSQTLHTATAPFGGRGGTNPAQVGLGIRLSSIVTDHSGGAITSTFRPTDLAIEGRGYFVVSDGNQNFYTRDGSFNRDEFGELVNANGLKLMGWMGEQVSTGAPLTSLHIPLGERMEACMSTYYNFAGNLDVRLSADPPTQATLTTGDPPLDNGITWTAVNSGEAGNEIRIRYEIGVAGSTTASVSGTTITVHLEDDGSGGSAATVADVIAAVATVPEAAALVTGAPVGTPTDFVQPMAARSLSGGTDRGREIYESKIYDSLGRMYHVDWTFEKVGVNEWEYTATIDDPYSDPPVLQEVIGSGILLFDTWGKFDPVGSSITDLEYFPTLGAEDIRITIDFSEVTQLAGDSSIVIREEDGYPAGELTSFEISQSGAIVGKYSNSMVKTLGYVALAYFVNPEGLSKEGGNLYQATSNSGDPRIGFAGQEGRGVIKSQALEMSNTDLAFEFTELITTSRAFQANTRVVTTSDEVLIELINMKR